MAHRDPEDIDRKPADLVGPEPELHGVGEIDLDVELDVVRRGRRVLGGSSDGAKQAEAKPQPSTARQPPSPRCTPPQRQRGGGTGAPKGRTLASVEDLHPPTQRRVRP